MELSPKIGEYYELGYSSGIVEEVGEGVKTFQRRFCSMVVVVLLLMLKNIVPENLMIKTKLKKNLSFTLLLPWGNSYARCKEDQKLVLVKQL